ncbi:MAG: MoxR family ATPase [Waddliaceae bacterium]
MSEKLQLAIKEMGRVIVGQKRLINRLFVALLSDGHVIVEGLPGLAKTLAVNTLSKVTECDFKRIQFTPDLLPADLTGTNIYEPGKGVFTVSKGPIFTNILLADEINRAPAKVQSALLEVMQERQVTIGGKTHKVKEPYFVLATQNPIEQEGTYPLPEAQTDRFMMKIVVDYPSKEDEKEIVKRMATLGEIPKPTAILTADEILTLRKEVDKVYADEKIIDYIIKLIFATRYPKDFNVPIDHYIRHGASPRATIQLILAAKAHAFLDNRDYVTPDDVKEVGRDVLRHRLRRTYEAEAEEVTPDDLIDTLFSHIPLP